MASDVEKYVTDYFSDFERNSIADFKRTQVKQKTVNQRLGAALDNFVEQTSGIQQRALAERMYSSIYLTFSNYVHAKYPEVMDLYGGIPGRFHLDGMRGTPKDNENLQMIDAFIDTGSLALQLMVSKLRLHHLFESDPVLGIWFRSCLAQN